MEKRPKRDRLFVILWNIRSIFNVGSIFRTADAVGVDKIYLCGYTPTPDKEPKMAKTALGAEKTVPWEKCKQITPLIKKLKKDGVRIAAIELHKKSKNLFEYKPTAPVALIFGHERNGVGSTALALADDILEIPMRGKKESLNVSVAAGIVLYQIRNESL